jgi:hypothetical protein
MKNKGWPATLLTLFAVIWGDGSVTDVSPRGLRQASVGIGGRVPVSIRVVVRGFCARVVCVAVIDGG